LLLLRIYENVIVEKDVRNRRHVLLIVVKNIDVRIKYIKKHVLYPIIKNMKKTFLKTFPLLDIVKIDYRLIT